LNGLGAWFLPWTAKTANAFGTLHDVMWEWDEKQIFIS